MVLAGGTGLAFHPNPKGPVFRTYGFLSTYPPARCGLATFTAALLHRLSAVAPGRRRVIEEVVGHTDTAATTSGAARRRLLDGCAVERPDEVVVVPHGAAPSEPPAREPSTGRPLILTWGPLGRGNGIEWAISALGALRDLKPRYLVVGQTDPEVLAREGEVYRRNLRNRAIACGVADLVEFDPTHREVGAQAELVDRADVVLLPYDSSEQVTSGVLVEALAARRPVVATGFPHAVELLADGAGLLVPHRDPAAIAAALRRVLTEPGLATGMSARSASLDGDGTGLCEPPSRTRLTA